MGNLDLYEKVRSVPKEAQKPIGGGRLKGMTDINPMWRLKTLTENFGVCGFGWYTKITDKWIEEGAGGEKTANVRIELFVKMDGEWSVGIEGIGGSALIAKESSGLKTDDECFKKAYTDAISVACKALGFGADIYWDKDTTKYDTEEGNSGAKTAPKTDDRQKAGQVITEKEIAEKYGVKSAKAMIVWLEQQYGKKIEEFTKEENEDVREFLQARKEKRDRETAQLQEDLRNSNAESPFDV